MIVWVWLGLELRRRWRSLVVLALLVAIASATVLTAVAGARRGASSLDRLMDLTLPATAAVLPNQPGFDWDAVRALPGVEALAEFAVTDFAVDGIPAEDNAVSFPFDAVALDGLERPVVLEGRLPDPARPDEAVVTSAFVVSYGRGVGHVVTVRLHDPAAIDELYASSAAPPPPTGPAIPTRIVGVVRSAWFADGPDQKGQLIPSPALMEQYRANLLGSSEVVNVNALVRLTGGGAALPAFRADLARVTGRPDIDMLDLTADAAKRQAAIDFEAGALLAFGLATLAAATVLVGQAVARYTTAAVGDLQVLRSIGLPRRQLLVAASAAPALVATAGSALGVAGAIAASLWVPFGTLALMEPAPGVAADPLVLPAGGLAAVLLVSGGAVAAAWFASSPMHVPARRRSAVAVAAARAGLPVPVLVGTRFALEPGRGPGALPVRPALIGAVVGVLGVLASFTFSAGVADAAANPSRFGQTHQLALYAGMGGEDYAPVPPVLAAIAADPDVAAVLDLRNGVLNAGDTTFAAFSYAPVGGAEFPTVVTSGRMPERPNEIVLGPATAEKLGAGVGDAVTVSGTRAAGPLTVTGIGFVPYEGHNNYDDGGWVTPAGYDRLIDGFKFHDPLIALRPGVDPAAVVDRVSRAAGDAIGTDPIPIEIVPPLVEAALIRNVEVLPVVLGGFLALLAVGAVGHALATAVRRRRHDVAVLRACGMTRWQARGVVVTQACVLAAVGLLFGVPLGVALGRTLWRVVADITPLQYQPPIALLALLLVAPLAVLIANALAAWPGWQIARARIGHVLRAE